MGGRERQGRHQTEGLAADAATDGHAEAGVPPVDLADLARLIRRALERAGGQERRSDPGQVILQDGDPTPVSLGLETLADDRRRDRRFGRQHGRDPLAERVEL